MTSWHSHGKIYNLGHGALDKLLDGPYVVVQEKVDGSQFSFGLYDGMLKTRSKGQELNIDAPEKMFAQAVGGVIALKNLLTEGYMYRGEYLNRPKHNTLAYDRVPKGGIILFDVCIAEEKYLSPWLTKVEADRLGLEAVPTYYEGSGSALTLDIFSGMLDNVSVLGGNKVEGLVIKNYGRFGIDGKVLMGKHVSEAFKEVHAGDWKERNPGAGDFITVLCNKYRTPARWAKGVQHLKEAGKLEGSPKDIGNLIQEVREDLKTECKEEIQQQLFKYAWGMIERTCTNGLPEWYKEQLMAQQFGAKKEESK